MSPPLTPHRGWEGGMGCETVGGWIGGNEKLIKKEKNLKNELQN